jgi:hypothetical protein
MTKKKWGVTFEGFDELMGRLDSLEGDLKKLPILNKNNKKRKSNVLICYTFDFFK